MDILEALEDPASNVKLDERELAAIKYWINSKQPALAPVKRLEFLALYLRGYSTDQIRQEHSTFSLGQIVHAKIIDKWDNAVEDYRKRLRDSMIDQVVLTTLDTARTLVDVLAATNHHIGKKARKYLETGLESDLPFNVDKVRDYQSLIASFQLITKSGPKNTEVNVTVNPAVTPTGMDETDDEDESQVLALLAGKAPDTLSEHMAGNTRTAPLLEVPGVLAAVTEAQESIVQLAKEAAEKVKKNLGKGK